MTFCPARMRSKEEIIALTITLKLNCTWMAIVAEFGLKRGDNASNDSVLMRLKKTIYTCENTSFISKHTDIIYHDVLVIQVYI